MKGTDRSILVSFFITISILSLNLEAAPKKAGAQNVCAISDVVTQIDRNLGEFNIRHNANGKLSVKGIVSEIDADTGESFLAKLTPHGDMNSTTAFRMEEKVVLSDENLARFFRETQESAVRSQEGGMIIPKWGRRDPKIDGKESKTVTEYGKSISFNDRHSGISIGFRPRFRKYFEYDDVGDTNALKNAKSVFGDLTVFELKVGGMAGFKKVEAIDGNPEKLVPIARESAVFKPRVFVTDEIADKIKNIDATRGGYLKKLDTIKEELLALKKSDGTRQNKPGHVNSMIEAVKLVLAKEPRLFKPDTVVSYNRDSYKFNDGPSEYQFTVDKNITIYKADPERGSSAMKDYLVEEPMYAMKDKGLFAELKTPIPVSMKADEHFVYQKFMENLVPFHNQSFSLNHGKYFLGKKERSSKASTKNPSAISTHGNKFWLIKSTGNLPSPPKVKDIIEGGRITVASNFIGRNNKTNRAVFSYKASNNDGVVSSVLDDIKFLDANGKEIPMKGEKVKLMDKALANETPDEPLHFIINGQKVEFLSHIKPEDTKAYKEFFGNFFYNPGKKEGFSRGVEDLAKIEDPIQLTRLERRLKYISNPKAWIIDRTQKQLFGLTVIGGLVALPQIYAMNKEEAESTQNIDLKSMKVVNTFKPVVSLIAPNEEEPSRLIMQQKANGSFKFLIPMQDQQKYNGDTQFKDSDGEIISMTLREDKTTGFKYFVLKEG